MYLQRLEDLKSSHLNWPTDCSDKPEKLTRLFDVCDDTLNSWKEVHHDFQQLQGDKAEPVAAAHRAFVKHCENALNGAFSTSKYGTEAIAHAVLKVWITNHQQELRHEAARIV